MYVMYIRCSSLMHALLFWRCGYTTYLLLGNGGMQPMYVVDSVHGCYILGTTSRPVGVAYHLVYRGACFFTVHAYAVVVYLHYGVEASVVYIDTYTYCWRMGLAGSFSNGVLICTCYWFHISALLASKNIQPIRSCQVTSRVMIQVQPCGIGNEELMARKKGEHYMGSYKIVCTIS